MNAMTAAARRLPSAVRLTCEEAGELTVGLLAATRAGGKSGAGDWCESELNGITQHVGGRVARDLHEWIGESLTAAIFDEQAVRDGVLGCHHGDGFLSQTPAAVALTIARERREIDARE